MLLPILLKSISACDTPRIEIKRNLKSLPNFCHPQLNCKSLFYLFKNLIKKKKAQPSTNISFSQRSSEFGDSPNWPKKVSISDKFTVNQPTSVENSSSLTILHRKIYFKVLLTERLNTLLFTLFLVSVVTWYIWLRKITARLPFIWVLYRTVNVFASRRRMSPPHI